MSGSEQHTAGDGLQQPEQAWRRRRQRPRRGVFFLRVGTDAVSFALAWLLAWWCRETLTALFGKELNPPSVYLQSLPLIVLGSLLTSGATGAYAPGNTRSPLEYTMRAVRSAFGSLLIVMSIGFLFKEFDFSRAVVMLFGVFSLVLLSITRRFPDLIERRLVKLGVLGTRVLIVGADATGVRALQKVQDHPEIGYRVIGFLDRDAARVGASVGRTPVLGTVEQLREKVLDERIDEVIIALPDASPAELMDLVMELDDLPVRVRVIADLFGVLSRETSIDLIEDVPIYELKGPDDSRFYAFSKRVFDLVTGCVAGAMFVATFPFIALAIKLDSPGPVFFVQDRVGRHGRIFRMWKYRTMRTDSPAYAVAPHEDSDPRITRVGRLLRKTSLDELPQVINVLRGEMSIVGPRPEMPFIVEQYNAWQRKRLDVLPGITGLWQILGRKDLPLHENLEYDFYYIKNRSLLLDLVIVLRTVTAVLSGKGAY
ncbi:MAG: sugar transferase [Candidatus Dadabacteria bacterium]|nr:MAG: sugar transferase [Candidatus Dadabacteria bacterium]